MAPDIDWFLAAHVQYIFTFQNAKYFPYTLTDGLEIPKLIKIGTAIQLLLVEARAIILFFFE